MKDRPLSEVLRALPAAALPLVKAVLHVADHELRAVYLVGGPVRDLLLGRPVLDVDLIVDGDGDDCAEQLAREAVLPGARVVSHVRFGTVCLETADARIDLARVRSETYAHPGALPKVAPGTLEQDLRRRDFTVNALAIPLSKVARNADPSIIAVEDGLRDLEQRQLRIFHSRSFHDDPTRALRAARLAPRLRFTLSRGSRSALRDALRDGAFGRVSGDRLRRELEKIFADARIGSNPAEGLSRLASWHVLGALEPGLELRRDAVAPLRRLGRAIERPPWRGGRWRPWSAGLSVWLAPLPPGLRARALRRFSVRGDLAREIAAFPKERDRRLRALGKARGRGAIDALLGDLNEENLHALHVWAPPAARRRIARFADVDRWRRPPVAGGDLVAIGLAGPAVGRALARIRAAYLDGDLKTHDEALALAREIGRRQPAAGGRAARRSKAEGRAVSQRRTKAGSRQT